MPRPERLVDPQEGPAQRFAVALRQLRQSAGNPTYRVLAKRAHYSATTLAQAAAGERLPTLAVALAYARACNGDGEEWTARWRAAAAELDAAAPQSAEESESDGDRSPYLGLAAYGPDDADRFRGRDRLIAALADRLARQRFVAVVGASGSGKSSLVRAGLLPAVHADPDRWSSVLITPGAHPLRECAARLADRSAVDPDELAVELESDAHHLGRVLTRLLSAQPADAECLLVVDQFEEVFSLCEEVAERDAFVRALLTAAHDPHSRTRVVIGLRADFYAHCTRLPELVAALQDAQLMVGPMTPEELSIAVTEPAARAGLMVEKALVATIIAEAANRPSALPFVSHALWETWRRRRGAGLFLVGYQAVGGLDGAIARSAERVYGELDEEHRRAARRILLRLTALGEGTEDTRRRVAHDELGGDAVTVEVVQRLAAARLVTIGEHSVQIAHEALIRGWPTLRDWLVTDRESLRAHRRLTGAAADWEAHDHDSAFLYRGSLLAAWADRDTDELNEAERRFLAASRAQQTREQVRQRRRLRATIGGLVAGLVTVSLLAVFAAAQTLEANAQRDLAIAGGLAAQSRAVLPAQPDLANLLALAGLAHSTSDQTVASAQAALSAPMHVARPLIGHSGAVNAVAFSPDGRGVATGGEDGTIRLWETATGRPLKVLTHEGGVTALAFSGDGRILASGGADGMVRLWDTDADEVRVTLTGHASITSLAFSPDGTLIAAANAGGTAVVWNALEHQAVATLTGHRGPVYAVAFSPDGKTVATGGDDNTARLWEPLTGQEKASLPGHTEEVFAVTFSPDGTSVATGSADGTAQVWNTVTNQSVATLNGHTRVVHAVAFAADGRTIVTGGRDGTVRIWSTATYQPMAVLTGHTDYVYAVAMHPDGTSIVSGGKDGTARLWETGTSRSIATLEGHRSWIDAVAVSPDSTTVATGSRDGTARLWDITGRGPATVLTADAGVVYTVAFSPNGTLLATGHADGKIRLWDKKTHQQKATLTGHSGGVASVAFSPDGKTLASGSTDGTARLWNVDKEQPFAVFEGHTDWVDAVAFSPDGKTLATASTDGTARLWDLDKREAFATLAPNASQLTALAFSPDGRTLATAAAEGNTLLWEIATRRVTTVLSGHSDQVTSLSFHPGGRSIATAGRDGTTRLWDPGRPSATPHPRRPRRLGHRGGVQPGRQNPRHHLVGQHRPPHTHPRSVARRTLPTGRAQPQRRRMGLLPWATTLSAPLSAVSPRPGSRSRRAPAGLSPPRRMAVLRRAWFDHQL